MLNVVIKLGWILYNPLADTSRNSLGQCCSLNLKNNFMLLHLKGQRGLWILKPLLNNFSESVLCLLEMLFISLSLVILPLKISYP